MSVIGACAWFWAGMVIAISFLEAPLKFRAPEVTLRIGLGIGRLVFRALNGCEVLLAGILAVALGIVHPSRILYVIGFATILVLILQLAAVRPALTRRSDAVLAGTNDGGSHAHLVYIGLELLKVAGLIATGILALGPTLGG